MGSEDDPRERSPLAKLSSSQPSIQKACRKVFAALEAENAVRADVVSNVH